MHLMPFPGVSRRRWKMGSMAASVLPMPVCATSSRWRPSRMTGMASRWGPVGSWMSLSRRTLWIRSSSSSNTMSRCAQSNRCGYFNLSPGVPFIHSFPSGPGRRRAMSRGEQMLPSTPRTSSKLKSSLKPGMCTTRECLS